MCLVYGILIFAVLVDVGNCAKILGIVPTPSYSHQVVFLSLFKELSLRGHQLTVLTTDPMNDPKLTNLTEIDLRFSYKIWNENIMKNALNFNDNPIGTIIDFYKSTIEIQDEQLSHPSVRALIEGDEKFDLIIIEAIMPAMFGFVAKFKCPYIAMFSLEATVDWYTAMGSPTHPVLYPDSIYPFDDRLTFGQRLLVTLGMPLFQIFANYICSLQEHLIRNHFGTDSPPAKHLIRNADMLFVNTDPIFHRVRPLVPTVLQIGGGSHMNPQKPLPQDLQAALDNATKGFIYFSLGTNVKSKDIPLKLRNIILETFSELPYTILWKFEDEKLPNKPNNVIVSPWLPQQDVLRHSNIKLFITQGGLQSLEEAIYSGVPMVGVPFFGDQSANVKRMEIRGVSLTVNYATLTKEEFKEKILEVIQLPRYRNKVRELASLAQDQPMTGLERAVWWSEYVIRHKGAGHLRSPLLDIPWYQYLLLDVLAVLLGSFLVIFYILYVVARFLVRLLLKYKRNDLEKKTK
ncbi:hypothetical protein RI129_010919 [Pyrocoelia pectoralis]|uniref:UDP-glucuronosyltransferase n=1 Tax=Pyrocoelia pectoralis TaxID=417401 RepID=A0AAN7V4A2_9COLE